MKCKSGLHRFENDQDVKRLQDLGVDLGPVGLDLSLTREELFLK